MGPQVGLFGSVGENVHQLQHISCFPVLAFLRHVTFQRLNTSSPKLLF